METEIMAPNGKGIQPVRQLMSRKSKLLTTAAIYFGNLCFGAVMGSYGPALVEFKNKYDTTIDNISVIITLLNIGYLFGCVTAGFAYNFINRQLGVVLLLSGMATSMYLTPHCPTQFSLSCVVSVLGFSCGAYDPAHFVWILEMWQAKAGPFVQAQGLFIGIGFFVPSLLFAPFLSADEDVEAGVSVRSANLVVPFTVIGGLATLAALCQAYLFVFYRYFRPPPEEGRQEAATEVTKHSNLEDVELELKRQQKYRRIQLIILAAVFYAAIVGMELCNVSFLSAFAQYGDLRLSQQEGAYLLSGLTGATMLGRVIGILVILKIRPQHIVCINVVMLIVGNGILLLFGNTSLSMLWAGAIWLGIGLSTIGPCFSVYIERHLVFTNAVGSGLLLSGGTVAAVYPLIIGKYIDENAMVLTYTNFFSIGWVVLVMISLYKITSLKRNIQIISES